MVESSVDTLNARNNSLLGNFANNGVQSNLNKKVKYLFRSLYLKIR